MIPTRDGLIERARSFVADGKRDAFCYDDDMADFALSEIRRALEAELEALRGTVTQRLARFDGLDERAEWKAAIYARLAALRSDGTMQVGEYAGIPIIADPSVKPGTMEARAGNVAAPALSDADVLERAAEILESMGWREATTEELRSDAAKLRAASAPKPGAEGTGTARPKGPEPKPVDVFRAFFDAACAAQEAAGAARRSWSVGADVARDWFCGLVEALDNIRQHGNSYAVREATDALSALRRKAEEASR